jgi:hypothetical protein
MAGSRYAWHMINFHETNLWILVTIQETTSQINKTKREPLLARMIISSRLIVHRASQDTICRRISGVGFLRQIRPKITTLLMGPNTMELPNGSSEAAHSKSGSQRDPCSGSTESVCLLTFRSIAVFDDSRPNKLVAGSGKSVLWYVLPQVR